MTDAYDYWAFRTEDAFLLKHALRLIARGNWEADFKILKRPSDEHVINVARSAADYIEELEERLRMKDGTETKATDDRQG